MSLTWQTESMLGHDLWPYVPGDNRDNWGGPGCEIWIVDNDTGIVYQGKANEGTGDMLAEVEDFLGQS